MKRINKSPLEGKTRSTFVTALVKIALSAVLVIGMAPLPAFAQGGSDGGQNVPNGQLIEAGTESSETLHLNAQQYNEGLGKDYFDLARFLAPVGGEALDDESIERAQYLEESAQALEEVGFGESPLALVSLGEGEAAFPVYAFLPEDAPDDAPLSDDQTDGAPVVNAALRAGTAIPLGAEGEQTLVEFFPSEENQTTAEKLQDLELDDMILVKTTWDELPYRVQSADIVSFGEEALDELAAALNGEGENAEDSEEAAAENKLTIAIKVPAEDSAQLDELAQSADDETQSADSASAGESAQSFDSMQLSDLIQPTNGSAQSMSDLLQPADPARPADDAAQYLIIEAVLEKEDSLARDMLAPKGADIQDDTLVGIVEKALFAKVLMLAAPPEPSPSGYTADEIESAKAAINTGLGLAKWKPELYTGTKTVDLSIDSTQFTTYFFYGNVADDAARTGFSSAETFKIRLCEAYLDAGGGDAGLAAAKAIWDRYIYDLYDPSFDFGSASNYSGGYFIDGSGNKTSAVYPGSTSGNSSTYGDQGVSLVKDGTKKSINEGPFHAKTATAVDDLVQPINWNVLTGSVNYEDLFDSVDKTVKAAAAGDGNSERVYDVEVTTEEQATTKAPVVLVFQIQTSWQMFDLLHANAEFDWMEKGAGSVNTRIANLYAIKQGLLDFSAELQERYPGNNLFIAVTDVEHAGTFSMFNGVDANGKTLYLSNNPDQIEKALLGWDSFGNCEHVHYKSTQFEYACQNMESNLSTLVDSAGNELSFDQIRKAVVVVGGATEKSTGNDGLGCTLPWSTFVSSGADSVYGIRCNEGVPASGTGSPYSSWIDNASNWDNNMPNYDLSTYASSSGSGGKKSKGGSGTGGKYTDLYNAYTAEEVTDALWDIAESEMKKNAIYVESDDIAVENVNLTDTVKREFKIKVDATHPIQAVISDSANYAGYTDTMDAAAWESIQATLAANGTATYRGTNGTFTITNNADGTVDVSYTADSLRNTQEITLDFSIQAKEDYIGSNNVLSNVDTPAFTYTHVDEVTHELVTYNEDGDLVKCEDTPEVNVPISFPITDGLDTALTLSDFSTSGTELSDLSTSPEEEYRHNITKQVEDLIDNYEQIEGTLTYTWILPDGTEVPCGTVEINNRDGIPPSFNFPDESCPFTGDEAGTFYPKLKVDFTPSPVVDNGNFSDATTGVAVKKKTQTGKVKVRVVDDTAKVEFKVRKEWEGSADSRPSSITYDIVATDQEGNTVDLTTAAGIPAADLTGTLNDANNWNKTHSGLPAVVVDGDNLAILDYKVVERPLSSLGTTYAATYSTDTDVVVGNTYWVSADLKFAPTVDIGKDVPLRITYLYGDEVRTATISKHGKYGKNNVQTYTISQLVALPDGEDPNLVEVIKLEKMNKNGTKVDQVIGEKNYIDAGSYATVQSTDDAAMITLSYKPKGDINADQEVTFRYTYGDETTPRTYQVAANAHDKFGKDKSVDITFLASDVELNPDGTPKAISNVAIVSEKGTTPNANSTVSFSSATSYPGGYATPTLVYTHPGPEKIDRNKLLRLTFTYLGQTYTCKATTTAEIQQGNQATFDVSDFPLPLTEAGMPGVPKLTKVETMKNETQADKAYTDVLIDKGSSATKTTNVAGSIATSYDVFVITNTPTDSLLISKQVGAGLDVDYDDAYQFQVDITQNGSPVAGTFNYTGKSTIEGVAAPASGSISSGGTISLKHGQSVLLEGVLPGYTVDVKELLPDGSGMTAYVNGEAGTEFSATSVAGETNMFTAAYVNKPAPLEVPPSIIPSVAPGKSKKIDYLGDSDANPDTTLVDENAYRLYLDVMGSDEDKATDFLFVIDNTGTMAAGFTSDKELDDYETNDKTKFGALMNALLGDGTEAGALDTILEKNPANRVAVVSFGGDTKNKQWSDNGDGLFADTLVDWTSEVTATDKEAIRYHNLSDVTNYGSGLLRASELLSDSETKSNGNNKVVVFVSDDAPEEWWVDDPFLLWSNYEGKFEGRDASSEAVNIDFARFMNQMQTAYGDTWNQTVNLYTVGLGDAGEFTALKEMVGVDGAASASKGNFSAVDNGEQLVSLFDTIIGNYYPRGVSITDELSGNVKMYEDQADVKVTWTHDIIVYPEDPDPEDDEEPEPYRETVTDTVWEGALVDGVLEGEWVGEGENVIDSVVYKPASSSSTTGKVTLNFMPGVYIGAETYTLSFNVELTDIALGHKGEYSVTGDDGTDYENDDYTNNTSSGKPGMPANRKAEILSEMGGSYRVDNYDHPVVQNDPSQNIDVPSAGVTTAKQIDFLGDDGADSAEYTSVDGYDAYRLYLSVAADNSLPGVDYLFVVDTSASMAVGFDGAAATGDAQCGGAINNLLNGFSAASTSDGLISKALSLNSKNKVAVVTYSDDAPAGAGAAVKLDWTDEATFANVSPGGSTADITKALAQAAELMDDVKGDDNRKVVIFIGAASNADPQVVQTEKVAANVFASDMKEAGYSRSNLDVLSAQVGVAAEGASFEVLSYIGSAFFGSGSFVAEEGATASEAKTQICTQITDAVTGYYPDRVVISDNLSKYVALNTGAAGDPDAADVVITRSDGTDTDVVWQGQYDAESEDLITGSWVLPGEASVIGSVVYEKEVFDGTTGRMTVVFKPDYRMGSVYTYTVSFNVHLTQAALDYEQDYYDKGDAGTDWGSNATSATELGLYSNMAYDDAVPGTGATVAYRSGDGDQVAELGKPVVQRPETTDVVFYKVSSKNDSEGNTVYLKGVEFTLWRCNTEISDYSTTTSKTGEGTIWGDPVATGVASDENGKITFTELRTGDYLLVESRARAGYELPECQWVIHVDAARKTVAQVYKYGSGHSITEVTIASTGEKQQQIINDPNVFLPNTSGSGLLALIALGALLIAAVAFVAMARDRKQDSIS